MRNGKKPTRKQKIRLGQAGLSPENWLVIKQKQNGELVILHKHTDKIRVVPASACQRRCDFVIFRRTGNVRKWRVKVCSL